MRTIRTLLSLSLILAPSVRVNAAPQTGSSQLSDPESAGPGPLAITPCTATRETSITPGNGQPFDLFGFRSALSGETLVVANRNTTCEGAVFVFERNLGGPDAWGEVTELTPSLPFPICAQLSVDVSGDTIVVGITLPNSGTDSGGVFLFERDFGGPDAWGLARDLSSPPGSPDPLFGRHVAIDGDLLIVGSPGYDDPFVNTGAAYIYERDLGGAGNWGMADTLTVIGATSDFFGETVAVSGDTVLVGTPERGEVHVFDRDGPGLSSWTEVTSFSGDSLGLIKSFGRDLALDGDRALIGEPDFVPGGRAYIYERNQGGPNAWGRVRTMNRPNPVGQYEYGAAVALDGDLALVGARRDPVSNSFSAGRAYVYERNLGGPDAWQEVARLTAATPGSSEELGRSVAIRGNMAFAGVPGSGSQSTGAVEVFTISPAPLATVTNRNAGANPQSLSADPVSIGGTLELNLDPSLSGHLAGWVFAFDSQISVTLGGGQVLLCIDGTGQGELFTGSGLGPGLGSPALFSVPVPASTNLCGAVLYVQGLCGLGAVPFALSNAQDVQIGF